MAHGLTKLHAASDGEEQKETPQTLHVRLEELEHGTLPELKHRQPPPWLPLTK